MGVKAPSKKAPSCDVDVKASADVKGPSLDVKMPSCDVDVKGPSCDVDVKAPSKKAPSCDVDVKGPSCDVDVKAPDCDFDLSDDEKAELEVALKANAEFD